MLGERAGAQPALVPAAELERMQRRPRPPADVERPDALRPAELVRAKAQQRDARGLDVDRNLARALRGVSVEKDPALAAERRHRVDVRQHAGLVVRVHQRDERGIRAQRLGNLCRIDSPLGRRREPGHREALALELTAGVESRSMLDPRCHDVTRRATRRARSAKDREIDALGRARSEYD